jgi:hypothetical protein
VDDPQVAEPGLGARPDPVVEEVADLRRPERMQVEDAVDGKSLSHGTG